ncbi:MAG: hypothetical protein RBT51_09455, partial [Ectothiorhodospiraceae bacterium]|nr:hypothetical protein [Ectothiorhodospiraceae bacterium]
MNGSILKRILLSLLLAMLGGARAYAATAPGEVLFVSADDTPVFTTVFEAFDQTLAQRRFPLRRVTLDGGQPLRCTARTLVVAAGSEAYRAAAADCPHSSLLGTLLPESTHASVVALHPGLRASAFFIDQPLATHLSVTKARVPQLQRFGILTADDDYPGLDAARREAEHLGLSLVHAINLEPARIIDDLSALAGRVDAIIAVPDPALYNRDTIVRIMLTTYRLGVPIIGYSESMLRAGALLAIHPDPVGMGREAALVASAAISVGRLA